ncbi:hypothetical protein MBLNU13_g10914t2 [Cladosporium sp. NU13]
MGDRHNRKRTRHRPIRRQRLCQQFDIANNTAEPVSLATSDQQPSPCTCWHPSTRQQSPSKQSLHQTIKPQCTSIAKTNAACGNPPITHLPETLQSRTRRVFGGVEASDDDESTELCAPMLDVVLTLFGGIDYDDDDDDGDW